MCWDHVDCCNCGYVECTQHCDCDETWECKHYDCKDSISCSKHPFDTYLCGRCAKTTKECVVCKKYHCGKCYVPEKINLKKECFKCSCYSFTYMGKQYVKDPSYKNFCSNCENKPCADIKSNEKIDSEDMCKGCHKKLNGPYRKWICDLCKDYFERRSCENYMFVSFKRKQVTICERPHKICKQTKICEHGSTRCENGYIAFPCSKCK